MQDQIFEQTLLINDSIDRVFDFFCDAKNLETITPPFLQFKIVDQSTPTIQKGTIFTYKLKIHGVPIYWKTLIEDWVPNSHFVDTQIKGPYQKWHHTHRFKSTPSGILVEDTVLYRVYFGYFGHLMTGKWVRSDVEKIFNFRKEKIESIFSTNKR